MSDPFALPAPDPEAAAHSDRLRRRICRQVDEAGGAIPFSRYMDLALYAPALGYYSAGARKFGVGGDFVTAPELSPVFGHCLARQLQQLMATIGPAPVLEIGAGSGALAATLLGALERLDSAPTEYLILELSGDLRARQRQTLAEQAPALLPRVRWLEGLPATFSGLVIANEVLDAIPCERFRVRDGQARWLQVRCQDGRPGWHEGPPAPELLALLDHYGLQGLDGYSSEVNPRARAWIRTLAEVLDRGVALLIDYGYPQHEYYLPDRGDGTLRCYYQHRAVDDPFRYPGLQDITAHVDFTAIAGTARDAGLAVLGFTSQGNFLIGSGLEAVAGELRDDLEAGASSPQALQQQTLALAGQIRRLTLPGEMGEAFKVLALGKGVEGPLRGFALNDQRRRLGDDVGA